MSYLTDVKPDCEAEILEKSLTQYLSSDKKMGAQTAEANIKRWYGYYFSNRWLYQERQRKVQSK